MRIRELLEMGEELDSNQSGMGLGSGTSGMGSMAPGAMGANPAQPMQTTAGIGQNTMGPPGSVTGPAGPTPTPPAPTPMKTAGMLDTFKNFMTTPQPIGDQPQQPPQPSAIQQSIGNSSLNPFSPVNKALQGVTKPGQPPSG